MNLSSTRYDQNVYHQEAYSSGYLKEDQIWFERTLLEGKVLEARLDWLTDLKAKFAPILLAGNP